MVRVVMTAARGFGRRWDTIRGGPGDDVLFGGNGDDQIFGNDGRDRIGVRTVMIWSMAMMDQESNGNNGDDELTGAGYDDRRRVGRRGHRDRW